VIVRFVQMLTIARIMVLFCKMQTTNTYKDRIYKTIYPLSVRLNLREQKIEAEQKSVFGFKYICQYHKNDIPNE
jgi:hypothetical protein